MKTKKAKVLPPQKVLKKTRKSAIETAKWISLLCYLQLDELQEEFGPLEKELLKLSDDISHALFLMETLEVLSEYDPK